MSCSVRPASWTALGAPLRDFLRMVRVVDVHDVKRTRAIVGQEDVRPVLRVLVDERRVHAGRDALRELGDRLGVRGSSVDAMTMPFLRSDAPSRVKTRTFPSGVVMMSFHAPCVRHDRVRDPASPDR